MCDSIIIQIFPTAVLNVDPNALVSNVLKSILQILKYYDHVLMCQEKDVVLPSVGCD